MSELPIGWSVAPLGELTASFIEQGGPASAAFTYVDISSIDNRSKQVVDAKLLAERDAPTRARQRLEIGDVLVSMTRPNLNAVAFVPKELRGSIGSTGFHVLRAICLEPRWLFYAVQTRAFVDAMCAVVQGALYPAVRPKDIRSFQIAVPPLPEQRRIVAEIEKQFSDLDAGVAALKRVQANLKRYRASVLKAACEGRLVPTEAELARKEGREFESASKWLERIVEERKRRDPRSRAPALPQLESNADLPKGWCWASVDMVGDVLLGRRRAPEYKGSGPSSPYLRVANIKDDFIDWSDVETMDFSSEHFARYRLMPGDILVSEGQSPERVGQSAILTSSHEGLCFQATLHRFRPLEGGPTAKYAQIVFRRNVLTGVFSRLASITTNIAHLTREKFVVAEFPLPPVAEQHRIVAEVDRRLSVVAEVEAEVEANLRRAAALRQSILRAAFSGKLVPQDPNDEPASVLLERIRAQRAAADTNAKKRVKKAGSSSRPAAETA